MRIKIIILNVVAVMFLTALTVNGQDAKPVDFSLQGAIDYAIKHNATYVNAELDVKLAVFKNKEVISMGLPQISGSADVKDYFEIPTSLLPGPIFGAPAGTFIPVKFGTQYQAIGGASASQLIFNSDYIVGVKAAKELRILSEKNLARTKTETIVTITKAYYTALINKERLKILDANIFRIKKMYDGAKVMNNNGFVEKIDVDRLELTYNNLVTEREKIGRFVGVSETLLKFQMGYDVKQSINLTDELKADQLQDIELLTDLKVNYEARNEYALLQSQLKLNSIELKRYKYQYLPSLVAYASYNQQAQRTKFDFLDGSQKWYPIGIFGGTLSVPIFNGGQKYYKIQQAKINIVKTNNSMNQLKSMIEFEVTSYSINYKNAFSSMQTQKKNTELAQGIYDTTKKKYEAGVGTNIDVVTAEAALKEAETNYLSAIYDLMMAKIDLDKALGNIK
ncbi:MAG TPA: TolC family protein [Bacteroidia bacterium]|jgi:outer membrane protein|nr:TolC family protein [Bacteroidia bacterium]